ncbi:zinc ribbon domain-containing protein [Acidicapsa acidisoli]|uniref:zinc ribbon domain-containing protein n=1 Tax=Acidicapsa acidisoli TaxID=1615681 RepID=UPI0021E0EF1A|nr:zinc ribbon domain-containing protein [Acidicapsa acidisoli]
MASFCTKCGAALSSDTQFCTSCGAPVAASAGGHMPAQVMAYPPPATAPPTSGGNVVKIILIVVAVIIGLGMLGSAIFAFTVWRVARSIHVEGPNGQVSINTPGGTISANEAQTYSASELGTDIYPGAQGMRGSMKMDLPTGSMVTGVFVTSDSKEQVVEYYRSKLGSGASVYDSTNSALLTLNKGSQESVMVTVAANSSQDGGKTRISIVHSKSNKPS